jgi:hypothetical protein
MPLDGATSNKELLGSGYPLCAHYSKQRFYLQQDRASPAAASDFHVKALSVPHVTQVLVCVRNSFWVRCLLRNELETDIDLLTNQPTNQLHK